MLSFPALLALSDVMAAIMDSAQRGNSSKNVVSASASSSSKNTNHKKNPWEHSFKSGLKSI